MSIIGHDGIHLCELHGINVKTYHYHLRRVRESLPSEICVIGLHNSMIDSLWNVSLFFCPCFCGVKRIIKFLTVIPAFCFLLAEAVFDIRKCFLLHFLAELSHFDAETVFFTPKRYKDTASG